MFLKKTIQINSKSNFYLIVNSGSFTLLPPLIADS